MIFKGFLHKYFPVFPLQYISENSGKYFETLSSSLISPFSTKIITLTTVIGFDIDQIGNNVS